MRRIYFLLATLPLLATPAHAVSITADGAGLLAYYSFDNNTVAGNTVADESGNGHHGTFNSHVIPDQPGKFGQSFLFDGVFEGSQVAIPFDLVPPFGNDFTLSLWFNTSDLGQFQKYLLHRGTFFSDQNSIIFGYLPQTVELYGPAHTGSDPRPSSQLSVSDANAWNNVVYTYDGSDFRGYLNGDLVFDNAIAFSLTSPSDLFIGSSGNFGYGNNYAGRIDEVSIWSRALTLDEIREFQTRPVIPEPSSAALCVLGILGLVATSWRRRASQGRQRGMRSKQTP